MNVICFDGVRIGTKGENTPWIEGKRAYEVLLDGFVIYLRYTGRFAPTGVYAIA